MSARLLVHGVLRATDAGGLSVVAFADLAALVSTEGDEEGDDAERSLALARRHHALLCEVSQRCDVLPVRLGAAFADEAAAARGLSEMADAFRARLVVCADAVEMSLVAEDAGAPASPVAAISGRDYLKARAAALTESRARPGRIAAALDALEAALAPHIRRLERRAAVAPRQRDLALLVQRGATVAVSTLVETRRIELAPQGIALGLRGPWPVYSFAGHSPASDT